MNAQAPEVNYHQMYVELQKQVIRMRRENAELEVALAKERMSKRAIPDQCPECDRWLSLSCAVHGHFEWPE